MKSQINKTVCSEPNQATCGKLGPTVYVAMSGGVDSSVAAALLKKQDFDVIGVFMNPWSAYAKASAGQATFCPWKEDREDAMRVAAVLKIPLLTWDFSKEYKKEVTDYMIREYRIGRTPNPDVMCYKEIKFGLFLKRALKGGANYIATGHYVIKVKMKNEKGKRNLGGFKLLQAKDKNKDQSYFLWTLTQEQLKHCLFPIGDYIKPEVRKLAKKFKLSNCDKKDSQGVCFIGPLDMKDFLKKYIKPREGNIVDRDGKTIGRHDGIYYYTIGQRHGLNISNGKGPYFIISKDIEKNIIYVGRDRDLGEKETKITGISWINRKPKLPAEVYVKIRYRSTSERAILSKSNTVRFIEPVRAITSGQSAVFYKGRELLGGGIID